MKRFLTIVTEPLVQLPYSQRESLAGRPIYNMFSTSCLFVVFLFLLVLAWGLVNKVLAGGLPQGLL